MTKVKLYFFIGACNDPRQKNIPAIRKPLSDFFNRQYVAKNQQHVEDN